MGEYADLLLNGDDCEQCGQYLGNGPGYPRLCRSCQAEATPEPAPKKQRVPHTEKPIGCSVTGCNRRFTSDIGLKQHVRDYHRVVK